MIKLLRTLRIGGADTPAYPRYAEDREWAVPASFLFAQKDPDSLGHAERAAFESGFLSLGTFGYSAHVSAAEVSDEELEGARLALAKHLLEAGGVTDPAVADEIAEQEIAYAVDLAASVPLYTLLTVQRELEESGEITETFAIVAALGAEADERIWDDLENNRDFS